MKSSRWLLGDIAGNVAACLLAFLVVMAVSAVVFRYLVGAPLAWAEEVEQLTLLWIIMVGLIYGKRKNLLLRMDILYNLLPERTRHYVSVFQECVHCVLFALMAFYGYKLALQVGSKPTSMLGIPQFWLYVSLPVGAAGSLVITLIQLYDLLFGKEAD